MRWKLRKSRSLGRKAGLISRNSPRPKESIKNECRRIIKRYCDLSVHRGTFVSETGRRKLERWPEREISLNFVLSLLETPVNKQTRLRQIKTCRSPLSYRCSSSFSRYMCYTPILYQLCNLSKINNESKCFTVHFRLDLGSCQFQTSSCSKVKN